MMSRTAWYLAAGDAAAIEKRRPQDFVVHGMVLAVDEKCCRTKGAAGAAVITFERSSKVCRMQKRGTTENIV